MRFLTTIFLLISSHIAWGESYYISRYATAVVPERMVTVPIMEPGLIEIHHRGSGQITKGTLLLKVNARELELEEAELKNQQRQNTAIANEALLQLRRRREELEFIMAQPAERRQFIESRIKHKADKEALNILNEKIAIQEASLKITNDKLQQAFDKRCETRIIRMPFDGKVQYHIVLGEEQEQLITQTGPLLTAVDDKALYAAITPEDAEIINLPVEKLELQLESGQGNRLCARWHHKKVERRNNREVLVYYFKLEPQDYETAWGMIGANSIAELFYQENTSDSLLYEPKSKLAEEAGTTPFETWEELITALRPGYRILFTGETHLCLCKTEQN